jgi:hypothetical protein
MVSGSLPRSDTRFKKASAQLGARVEEGSVDGVSVAVEPQRNDVDRHLV